jgi:hypothetical protein
MTTKNPFPGMNPFFELRWQDAHTRLITHICETLQERLPGDLVAGAEEQVVAIGADAQSGAFRPDVQVRHPWESAEAGGVAVVSRVASPPATEPTRVFVDEHVERWIEIHDATGRLVTVIELLSPANKEEESARSRYRNKRHTLMSGGVNLVEIDLVRRGCSVFPEEIQTMAEAKSATYVVCVFRAITPREREAYFIGLRERLPALSIPLRPTDPDVVLDLQPLIDQCHERGRYHRLNYRCELTPRFPAADAAWVDALLREHQLR